MSKSSWNLQNWLDWQQTINSSEIDLSLERVKEVSSRLNLVNQKIKIFLVAGTNGKGTTVSLIENILITKGLSVGSYTSPHLISYNERVTFNKKLLMIRTLLMLFFILNQLERISL